MKALAYEGIKILALEHVCKEEQIKLALLGLILSEDSSGGPLALNLLFI